MQSNLRILLLSSSLRQNSCNTGILRYILSLAPSFPEVDFELFPLKDLPLYNGDLDPTENRNSSPPVAWPASVASLREKSEKADALILAVSENNGNVAPPLLNAIAWGSRPEKVVRNGQEVSIQPICGKKVALVSSAGGMGGLNGQKALRNMVYLKLEYVDLAEGPLTTQAYQPGNFNEKGDLVEEKLRNKVKDLTENLVKSIAKK